MAASGNSGPNAERAEPGWAPALVGGAYQTGVLAMKSLARRGVKVGCFDTDPTMDGFHSVYGKGYHCPNPDTDPTGWVDYMVSLSAQMDSKPVLISSADQFVSAIHRHEKELAEHFIVSPGTSIQGALATKETQYALAAVHGMPMPATFDVESAADLEEVIDKVVFPCLLKPHHFREWAGLPENNPLADQKVAIARNAEDLNRFWTLAAAVNPNTVVQEIIVGPELSKRLYIGCYDRNGRRIADAMFAELRCQPIGFGNASVIQPVADEEASQICDDWLRSMGYRGVCEVQAKRDQRDGQLKLIEANPRFSGGGTPAPRDGVDTPWLHYLDMIGMDVTPVRAKARDFRHIVLRTEARSIVENRRAGVIGWREVFAAYRPPLEFFDLDPRDWRIALRTIYRLLKSIAGVTVRGLMGTGRSDTPVLVALGVDDEKLKGSSDG